MVIRARRLARASSFSHVKASDVFDFIALGLFTFIVSDLVRRTFEIKVGYANIGAAFSFVVTLYLYKKIRYDISEARMIIPISSLYILIMYIYYFYKNSFGELNVGAIIFHLRYGFEGVETHEYSWKLVRYLCLFALGALALSYLGGRNMWFRRLDRFLAIPLLISTPIASNAFGYLLHASDGNGLVAEYAVGQIARERAKPKNLLLIYVESGERTFSELAGGSDFFGDMNAIAAKGLDIRGIRQLENTSWTIAGMVASQCGVPLQPAGSLARNKLGSRDSFLPNVTCLGDILKTQGYSLTFVGGADLAFAGKGKFLSQHGYDELFGRTELQQRAGDYLNQWGLYDDTLFEVAQEKLRNLAKQDRPYVLSILTVGGHFPEGFPTRSCMDKFGPVDTKQILFAVKCTGFHVRQFIETAEQKGLLKNTVLVVMSDHLVMKNAVSSQLDRLDRMNYFAVIGEDIAPEVRTKNSATIDVFPTLLELMGFDVPGRTAGLGVSLLSPEPSLTEKYGNDALNDMIRYGYELGDMMWIDGEALPGPDGPMAGTVK